MDLCFEISLLIDLDKTFRGVVSHQRTLNRFGGSKCTKKSCYATTYHKISFLFIVPILILSLYGG